MKLCCGATPVNRIFFVSIIEGTFSRTTTGRQISAGTLANPPAGRTWLANGSPKNNLVGRNGGEQ